jgi:hypothetical protein
MALIVGFPDFAASAKPSPASLNDAVSKIVQQLGGVDGAGSIYPGNLDLTNHVAAVGFRNTQKRESRSVYALTIDLNDNAAPFADSLTARRRAGPVSQDGQIVAVALSAGLIEGHIISSAQLTLTIGRRSYKFGPDPVAWDISGGAYNNDIRWETSIPVAEGESIYAVGATVGGPGLPDYLIATVWIAADHRS